MDIAVHIRRTSLKKMGFGVTQVGGESLLAWVGMISNSPRVRLEGVEEAMYSCVKQNFQWVVK